MLAVVVPDRCRLVRPRRPMHLRMLVDVLVAHLGPQSVACAAKTACGQLAGSLLGAAGGRALAATRVVAPACRPGQGYPIGTGLLFLIPGPPTGRFPRFRVAMMQEHHAR